MPIPVTCECGKRYRVKDGMAGRTIRCKECGSKLQVVGADSDRSGQRSRQRLPPRRVKKQSPRSKPKSKPEPAPSRRHLTLEERIEGRAAETEEQEIRALPFRWLWSACVWFGLAALSFFYLNHLEQQSAQVVRMPAVLAFLYRAVGKWGIVCILGGFGILSVVAAILPFFGIAIFIDDED